jgi:hypothetical protein
MNVFLGYSVGAALMIGAGALALWFGVAAEGKSLEAINPEEEANPEESPAPAE